MLQLFDNQLSSLPEGVFTGLSALRGLDLDDNLVDPLPVTVSLVLVGTGAFKATVHTSAPFNMVVPVSVTNGAIDGGATTVTIPTGSVESGPLVLTRTPGATGAVTADIGTLPGLPTNVDPGGPLSSSGLCACQIRRLAAGGQCDHRAGSAEGANGDSRGHPGDAGVEYPDE